MRTAPQRIPRDVAALVVCVLAWAAYVAIFGFGAASDGDTESYRHFLVVRSLGYPSVLWLVDNVGLSSYLGALQLAAMFVGFFALWRAVAMRLSSMWAWAVLALCLVNVEVAKYAFREAPEALFVAVLAWHLSAVTSFVGRSKDVLTLAVSGAAIILLRPAGLPILIATTLALVAYGQWTATLRFVVGLLLLVWVVPSVANGVTRGFYAPQIYGGFHTIMPVTNAILIAPSGEALPEPLSGWRARLTQLRGIYGHPRWPFEQALFQAIASPYVTQALTPEFGSVEGQSIAGLRAANERGREGLWAMLRANPWAYVEGVSANAIGLLAAPGFIDRATKDGLAARLAAADISDPLLMTEMSKALETQRVVPLWALSLFRYLGFAMAAIAFYLGVRLAVDLLLRVAGRGAEKESATVLLRIWGTMIAGYILMVGLVSAIPRFTLAIYPLLVLFLITLIMSLHRRLDFPG